MMVTANNIPVPEPMAPKMRNKKKMDSTHEIGRDGESANKETTKVGSDGDDALEFLVHGAFTMPPHDHLLVFEHLGDVAGRGAGHFNPGLGKECAGHQNKGNVGDKVDGVADGVVESVGRGNIVGNAAGRDELAGSLKRLRGISEWGGARRSVPPRRRKV